MLDTPAEIVQKQREIMFAKTSTERFLIGIEAIALGRLMVENNIKQQKTDISELDLKIAIFKRYYQNSFNSSELESIILSLKQFYD